MLAWKASSQRGTTLGLSVMMELFKLVVLSLWCSTSSSCSNRNLLEMPVLRSHLKTMASETLKVGHRNLRIDSDACYSLKTKLKELGITIQDQEPEGKDLLCYRCLPLKSQSCQPSLQPYLNGSHFVVIYFNAVLHIRI